jgi:hypothetical protein
VVPHEERIRTILDALKSQVVKMEECFHDRDRPERLKSLSVMAKGIILSASVIDELSIDLSERVSMAARV